jgi:hypothetical protein
LASIATLAATSTLFANGSASQTGVPGTGSASASNKGQGTNVIIENETLKIDLHPESAAVDVHYRMHNIGPKVQQDFFFPVERWGIPQGEATGASADLDYYQIRVDSKELKWTDVRESKDQTAQVVSGPNWQEKHARHSVVEKICNSI